MESQEPEPSNRTGLMARIKPTGSRVPKDRVLYDRLLPTMILILAFIMTALIVFAAGVLLGLIPFN